VSFARHSAITGEVAAFKRSVGIGSTSPAAGAFEQLSAGNVGIGTTAPASTLEVAGNVTISNGGTIKHEAWTTSTFTNSWLDYGSTGDLGYGPTAYYRGTDGLVRLRGLIRAGSFDVCAFTLPSGYRPSKIRLMTVMSGGGACRLDINPTGCVVPRAGSSNSWLSLDGVAFRAVSVLIAAMSQMDNITVPRSTG
jgi:hypothetical protein